MFIRFKALVVVLVLAWVVFTVAAAAFAPLFTNEEFRRRRNVWLILTVSAFLAPSFWIYALIAVPLLLSAGRKDSNPVALYVLLLHVVPPIQLEIPMVGINKLFAIDNYRMLAFFVLIPAIRQFRRGNSRPPAAVRGPATGSLPGSRKPPAGSRLDAMDWLLLGWGLVEVIFFVPPDLPGLPLLQDSITNVLRRAFLFFPDVYLVYYGISRLCTDRKKLVEALAAYCLGMMVLAVVAMFESTRHWLLYVEITKLWSAAGNAGFYLFRGDAVRAQASAGHALALGYLLAVAFGCWLYVKTEIAGTKRQLAGLVLLWLGLIATYSRGPWVGGLSMYFIFMALRPRGAVKVVRAVAVVALLLGLLTLLPFADRVTNALPFTKGSVDTGTVVYRQQLAARAWELFLQHPFFGDQVAYSKMEDLRQGEGIIDLVNTYAQIVLFYGVAGLGTLMGFMLLGITRAYIHTRRVAADPPLQLLGIAIIASCLGAMIMLATSSFILGLAQVFFVLGGFTGAYIRIATAAQPGLQARAAAVVRRS